MKTIFKLSLLILAVALSGCGKDTPEAPPEKEPPLLILDDFKVENGRIVSPEWLLVEMEKVAERHTSNHGIPLYPYVYSVEYDGQDYILLVDLAINGPSLSYMYYTLQGEYIEPSGRSGGFSDKFRALDTARSENAALMWSLSMALAANPDDIPDYPPGERETIWRDVETVDGRMVRPMWLALEIEKGANRWKRDDEGNLLYRSAYRIEYNGQDYICIFDGLSSISAHNIMFYTVSGEYIDPGSVLRNDYLSEPYMALCEQYWLDWMNLPVISRPPARPRPVLEGFKVDDDGWISSPEWLAQEVKKVADRYQPSEVTGRPPYPYVYLVELDGQVYIVIRDRFTSGDAYMFFTTSGEYIDPGASQQEKELDSALEAAMTNNAYLIWNDPNYSTLD